MKPGFARYVALPVSGLVDGEVLFVDNKEDDDMAAVIVPAVATVHYGHVCVTVVNDVWSEPFGLSELCPVFASLGAEDVVSAVIADPGGRVRDCERRNQSCVREHREVERI